jgi:hypothetical protein
MIESGTEAERAMAQPTQDLAEFLRRESFRICSMIFNPEFPKADIALQIHQLREYCETAAPEKADLFEAVYVGRFRRLWEQWREADDE